jgi:hypothetical protein
MEKSLTNHIGGWFYHRKITVEDHVVDGQREAVHLGKERLFKGRESAKGAPIASPFMNGKPVLYFIQYTLSFACSAEALLSDS